MKLHYLIKEPKIILETNPMLLLLHGYGSNEEDLFSFASEFPDHYYVISARAPYDLQYGSYAWYAINFDADQKKFTDTEQAKKSKDLIANFIDELLAKYPINANDVNLVGFSQGCILSYAVALSFPEKINRAILLGGYLDTEIATKGFENNNFKNLKIFASHGTVDQVVSVLWARQAKPLLDQLHIENIYTEYPIGHGISPQNFHDFNNWLAKN
jgi:phospholipase/carboxylesterase